MFQSTCSNLITSLNVNVLSAKPFISINMSLKIEIIPYKMFVSTTLMALLSVSLTEASNCPPGWVDGTLVGMGCLMFNVNRDNYLSWEDAKVYCQEKHNSTLVEFGTEEQLEFVKMKLFLLEEHDGKKFWWTSGTDTGREGIWYWASSLTHVADFVWGEEGHESTSLNCLYLHWNYGYSGDDTDCKYLSQFGQICQRK